MLIGQNKNNAIINGRFDFWQRGTSMSAGSGERRLADRFVTNSLGTTVAPSRQSFTLGQTVVPGDPVYFHRKVVASSVGVGNYATFEDRIESVRTFAGKKAVLSFWAKADATKSFSLEVQQSFGADGSPSATVLTHIGKYQMTSTWTRFDIIIDVPTIVGKTLGTTHDGFLGIVFWMDAGTNFNARTGTLGQQSGTFDFANVQMIEGEVAGDFELAGKDIAGELQLCQRYYERSYNINILLGTTGAGGNHWSQQHTGYLLACGAVDFVTQKRADPTMVYYSNQSGTSGTGAEYNTGGTFISNRSLASVAVGQRGFTAGSADGTMVPGNYNRFHWTADAEF